MLKAVLLNHTWIIDICKDPIQKTLIMHNLKEFANTMNVVNLVDGPKKTDAMLKYEQGNGPNPNTNTHGTPNMPPPPPELWLE